MKSDDESFVRALKSYLGLHVGFTVDKVERGSQQTVSLVLKIGRDPREFWLRVPLPSSSAEKPWQYVDPESPDDSALMLFSFLQEQFRAGVKPLRPRWVNAHHELDITNLVP